MNFLNAIFAAPAILSFALLLWQFFAARKFPLHQRIAATDFAPAISILKPLKGCDDTTAASLQSWLNQNYSGQTQILFGVADANDPACKIVRELLQKNPARDAQLVICGEPPGANANFVAPLRDEKFGLVNCFYRLANSTTLAMQWEAVAVMAAFVRQRNFHVCAAHFIVDPLEHEDA